MLQEDLQFNEQHISIDQEIQFIETEAEKPYIDGMIREKLNESQIWNLLCDFESHSKDETI